MMDNIKKLLNSKDESDQRLGMILFYEKIKNWPSLKKKKRRKFFCYPSSTFLFAIIWKTGAMWLGWTSIFIEFSEYETQDYFIYHTVKKYPKNNKLYVEEN